MKKSLITLIASIVSLSMILSACGGGKTEGGNSSAGGDNSPLPISIMTVSFATTPPAADGPVQKAIEQATNSKLNIQWVSNNSYSDKLNVTLASGSIPDVVFVGDPFSPVFRQMVAQGAFWEVGPYMKDYANFTKNVPEIAWELTKQQDGKNYGIPRPRPSEADGFIIMRKDWLDRSGMGVPTTTDEFYQALKAFKDNDASGKKNTVPYTAYVSTENLGALAQIENSFTGANGNWKLANDKLTFTALLPEERQALEYLKKLADEKLIPEDFASIKQTVANDLFKAGRSGAIFEKAGGSSVYTEPVSQLDPKFKLTDFYPLTNLNGYNPKGTGFSGVLAIPKSVSEDKMKKILQVLDTWQNDDVYKYQKYGIEGTHHTVQDGKKGINSNKMTEDGIGDYSQIVYIADPYASSVKEYQTDEVNDLYRKIQDERSKTSVADVSVGLYSPTASQELPNILKNMTDLKLKILLGQMPLSAWDDYVNKMKSDEKLTKITQELNEAYQNRVNAK